MKRQLTTILFDLDGTIADTNEIIMRTIVQTLESASGRRWSREELLPVWGIPLRNQLFALYPAIDMERAIPFYRALYAKYHDEILTDFPEMRQVLSNLHSSGYRLGVVTSKKFEGAHSTLAGIGYSDLFEHVVVEEDTVRHKPAPDPLLHALALFGVAPDKACYVGDNPDDIVAAHAAGMSAIAVGWCLRPRTEIEAVNPEKIIDRPEELIEFVEKQNNSAESHILYR